jgi:Ca2+-binding RTX toxin-like protein
MTPNTFVFHASGAENDVIFGELGHDTIQGDGSIGLTVSATVDASGLLTVQPSVEAASDIGDYIEGNGGADLIFGNLGQDDIIGGSSNLYSLTAASQRPDSADRIFGGAGTDISRNNAGDVNGSGHAIDADVILDDNGDILKLVRVNGTTTFLTFNPEDFGTQGL